MCDDNCHFVLDKKYFVRRGPNIDLKTLGDKWKNVAEPEKDIVVIGGEQDNRKP